ncbi:MULTISPECIES: VOC family protein [Acetobacter]|uniref:VOC family protein n=1 Tax=Acetobacter thailandicus TaxID=1502842 RepID=A0ABT3QC53_9PROT|nr:MULTISPECIES: VOC family protein [Acetobacter]MBS0961192.1 VOC family protein [Acetobacter thailandicus]MBS0981427.1 VOC family protein [Acetobacter thailandicus]MBS0986607.1 VOC family protein [Acetobacter thailandicus]MBS1003840.1 VOC family protein [Acetobacter thailandicus]MCX2562846.1 VOC family protein [Acetobacter thailandicus]
MFSHVTLGSNDIPRSKVFYDAIMAAQGAQALPAPKPGILVYALDGQMLIITTPINGQPATYANGGTIGLRMTSADQVDAWHRAGVINGGVTAENPPGIRHTPMGDMYLAYLRDPDGNKLCAIYNVP